MRRIGINLNGHAREMKYDILLGRRWAKDNHMVANHEIKTNQAPGGVDIRCKSRDLSTPDNLFAVRLE